VLEKVNRKLAFQDSLRQSHEATLALVPCPPSLQGSNNHTPFPPQRQAVERLPHGDFPVGGVFAYRKRKCVGAGLTRSRV
jgi:hypothetical protein